MKPALLALSIIWFPSVLYCGGSSSFSLNLPTEITLLSTGAGVNLASIYFIRNAAPPSSTPDCFRGWPSFDYSKTQDRITTVLTAAGVISLPLLLDRLDRSQTATIGLMYLESALLAWGTKDLIKGLFPKYRPYVSSGNTPAELLNEPDRYFSFPSGHTAMAFTTATFSSYIFSKSKVKPALKVLFAACNFGLASTVATLRVTSGHHYFIDVLGGAAIGTASGLIVPLTHQKKNISPVVNGKMVGFSIEL
ncbi:MAG TPA: phosphatase PAP2 family protein [Chitinispirillaceae bacterium]|jgi:membrane-associated phospholipid phosphatase|nr:phosphatase PAP2 family protein [Chitinispirillaceae bacterium]